MPASFARTAPMRALISRLTSRAIFGDDNSRQCPKIPRRHFIPRSANVREDGKEEHVKIEADKVTIVCLQQ